MNKLVTWKYLVGLKSVFKPKDTLEEAIAEIEEVISEDDDTDISLWQGEWEENKELPGSFKEITTPRRLFKNK